jgi:hypothetical protein
MEMGHIKWPTNFLTEMIINMKVDLYSAIISRDIPLLGDTK